MWDKVALTYAGTAAALEWAGSAVSVRGDRAPILSAGTRTAHASDN